MRGYAEKAVVWFGKEARLEFGAWDEWQQAFPEDAGTTWDHLLHNTNGRIEKVKRLIDYQPWYDSLKAVYESVVDLIRI